MAVPPYTKCFTVMERHFSGKRKYQPAILFTLSSQERQGLQHLITPVALSNTVRRAQALLWLDAGQSARTVAKRLQVSRQTVYNWISAFQARRSEDDIGARLTDKHRSGRPRTLPKIIDPLIAEVIEHDPRAFGYHSSTWSAKLLAQHLRDAYHVAVNRASMSPALARLGKQNCQGVEE